MADRATVGVAKFRSDLLVGPALAAQLDGARPPGSCKGTVPVSALDARKCRHSHDATPADSVGASGNRAKRMQRSCSSMSARAAAGTKWLRTHRSDLAARRP